MAQCTAIIVDAETGSEGRYDFDAPADLLNRSPSQVVATFWKYADRTLMPGEHVDYHLYGSIWSREKQVVTAMGALVRPKGEEIPFTLIIFPRRD